MCVYKYVGIYIKYKKNIAKNTCLNKGAANK